MSTTVEAGTEHAHAHGWIDTESVESRLGCFEFHGGYPTPDTARQLADLRTLNRAIEVYLAQMPGVSWSAVWSGVAAAGNSAPNQLVVWETLMDAETLLLTGNCETVYGLASLDLKRDGPIVVDLPAGLLGGIDDMWQHSIVDIGPTGADKGKGGTFVLLPPGFNGIVPDGHVVVKCTTYYMSIGVRGFLVDGKPDEAAARMKTVKIYPLASADSPPAMTFVNGSHEAIDTIVPDTYDYFETLAALVDREPADVLAPHERFQLASIGIEKGKRFAPSSSAKKLLAEAVRVGSAMARANSFASTDAARLVYQDRRWEWAFIGGSATWDSQGFVNSDRRAAFAYVAAGMSPAMVKQVVGQGSQYLWAPRDSNGACLDGGSNYHLHLPPNIPVKNFWSVVVYDAVSRSMLQNGQPFPSVSQYTDPKISPDGSVDIYFGPYPPRTNGKNWIRTIEGRGWFTLLRFYGPTEAFFDRTWKPDDIIKV